MGASGGLDRDWDERVYNYFLDEHYFGVLKLQTFRLTGNPSHGTLYQPMPTASIFLSMMIF
jgi:hypothetical protein